MNDDPLPPLLLTSDVGSFAHNTLKVRVPRILRDTIKANDFPPDVVRALEALHRELTSGPIQPLREDAADVQDWNRLSAPYFGRTWLDVQDGASRVDWDACMGCGVCADACSQGALTLVRDARKGMPLELRALLADAGVELVGAN